MSTPATRTLDVRLNGVWTRVSAPTLARPVWHDAQDGTAIHYTTLAATAEGGTVRELHGAAIAGVVDGAIAAADRGEHREARRLSIAASRLCAQTIGLWPVAPA